MNDDALLARITEATAFDTSGDKIGSVGQVYLDDATGEPTWVTVNTGFFGTSQSFAPLQGHRFDGDDLVLAHSKDVVKDAPRVDADGHISEAEEAELYRYYEGLRGDHAGVPAAGGVRDHDVRDRDLRDGDVRDRDLRDGDVRDRDHADVRDRDVVDHDRDRLRDGNQSMTASEERLNVGTEQVEAGRARLRKYVTTEEETVTVPVSKERVVVERHAVDGKADAGRIDPNAADVVEEVTLREERPVVSKDTVAVEEVSLGKETVTDNQTVTETVSKEHIDVDGAEGDVRDDGKNRR